MNDILIVDDDASYLKSLTNALKRDFSVMTASALEEAKDLLGSGIRLILLDIRLNDADPSNQDGIVLLKLVKAEWPDIPVVLMTAYGDIDIAVEAMKLGAADFVQKTKVDVREFKKTIRNVLEKSKLQKKVIELEEKLHKLEPWDIVGNTPEILEMKRLIDIIAKDGQTTILIRGETGTGKELVARAIHARGVRKDGPFVPVSISSLRKTLVESELFGHEKGAFTGADKRKIGYIEKADRGVLFLDEIGELDHEIQLKLLRFLDNKTFSRIGSTEEITVNLQLLTATNKNLEEAVDAGSFRKDLYYRLKTLQISLPSLAERVEDIPELAYHFLSLFKDQGRTAIKEIPDQVISLFKCYHWPGNVRELKSFIERAIIYADYHGHSQIMPDDLPYELRTKDLGDQLPLSLNISQDGISIEEELAKLELAFIEKALSKTEGMKANAGSLLGYNNRFTMRRRVENIIDKFPHLLSGFPIIEKSYKNKRVNKKGG